MNHPSQDSLERYASGGMKSAARMAVGQHLRGCAVCRRTVERLELLGGGLLEDAPTEALASGALAQVLRRLDQPEPVAPRTRLTLERMMAEGWWLPMGQGLAVKLLRRLADPGERAYLIRAEPGVALPEHGHTDREWIVILEGAFDDDSGHHKAGDLVENGPQVTHQPIASPGQTCLCLAVTEGPLKLTGVARLLQPFLGL
jgi:putative transcriptional regulator